MVNRVLEVCYSCSGISVCEERLIAHVTPPQFRQNLWHEDLVFLDLIEAQMLNESNSSKCSWEKSI